MTENQDGRQIRFPECGQALFRRRLISLESQSPPPISCLRLRPTPPVDRPLLRHPYSLRALPAGKNLTNRTPPGVRQISGRRKHRNGPQESQNCVKMRRIGLGNCWSRAADAVSWIVVRRDTGHLRNLR